MTDLQAATTLDEALISPTPATSSEEGGVTPPMLRARAASKVVKYVAATLMTCSSVLGSAEPWASPESSASVALETPLKAGPTVITLSEARRLALEFSERIQRGYARLAKAEAAADAFWEQEE